MINSNFNFDDVFDPKVYLYFYHDILTPERLQSEIDFLIKYTELNRPLKILDLACGFGRHANSLAKLGHDVTGIDYSTGFLDFAKAKALELGLSVHYLQGDMRNINDVSIYDRIYVLFSSIGYFTDEENESVFKNIFNALTPGGLFCFDSHNRDTFLTYLRPSIVLEKDGNLMIDQIQFDSITGRSNTKRTVVNDNQVKTCHYSIRLYNPNEIMDLFKRIGFSSTLFYDGWSGNHLNSQSKRMVVVARK